MQAPALAWSSVIALAVFASCLAYMFISVSIRNLGLNTTNLLANLIPLFTAVMAYILLREPFGFYKIAGGILVLTGVLLFELIGSKKKKEIANPHK
jgi:drug/metabolite transporter (DMT)-like permease